MNAVVLLLKSLGVFLGAVMIAALLALVVGYFFPPVGVAIGSMAPLAGIGAAVGYFKDERAKGKRPASDDAGAGD